MGWNVKKNPCRTLNVLQGRKLTILFTEIRVPYGVTEVFVYDIVKLAVPV